MLTLHRIYFENDGRRIAYEYSFGDDLSKYFKGRPTFFSEYDSDVSDVPPSIASIPFFANFAPIAWFAGFDISAPEIDATFLRSLENIRIELGKHHVQLGDKTSVIRAETVENTSVQNQSAMLFSGGVDAFATYFWHYDEKPALFTIKGADIPIDDDKQWDEVVQFNENEPILRENKKHYITINLLDFYAYPVNSLLPNGGWWGNIQHGLALISATAPVAFMNGYSTVYIASTRSEHMQFNPWGSMPETDNLIAWASTKAVHDAYELKRQDKVNTIISTLKKIGKTTSIRVCYSELKTGLNCSKCEKCVRTMFGIMIAGGNPNEFGFHADASFYDRIEATLNRGFSTKGAQFFWREFLDELRQDKQIFVFGDKASETQRLQKIKELIAIKSSQPLNQVGTLQKIKGRVIRTFPGIFKFYLRLRTS